jgi:NTP pyrophosphatase (non-canonical NTP hydrolase)
VLIHDYVDGTRKTAIYPGVSEGGIKELFYLGLGLSDEAAEVAEKINACIDDGIAILLRSDQILPECGDVAWYMARLMDVLHLDPCHVAGLEADGDLAPLTSRGIAIVAGVPDVIEASTIVRLTLRLCATAGKIAGKTKKLLRDANGDPEKEAAIRATMGPLLIDVFRCWTGLVIALGGQPKDVFKANQDKLLSRLERGVLQGSGDAR